MNKKLLNFVVTLVAMFLGVTAASAQNVTKSVTLTPGTSATLSNSNKTATWTTEDATFTLSSTDGTLTLSGTTYVLTPNSKYTLTWSRNEDNVGLKEITGMSVVTDFNSKKANNDHTITIVANNGVTIKRDVKNNNSTIGFNDNNLSLTQNMQFTIGNSGGGANACTYTLGTITITYTYDVAANLKVSQGKYGTFCAPFDVTIPSGIKAYTVPRLDGATLNLSEVTTTIPANTPVVVEGVDNDYDGNFYGPGTDATTCDGGNLVGILKTGTKVPAGSYLLQTKDGKQGFYKRTTEANGTANRCYLKADAEVKTLNFEAEETSIENAFDFMPEAIQTVYTGNGVKVNNLQKGLNIVKMMNGQVKKIMVK